MVEPDVRVTLAQPGRHQVGNSLAVLAAAPEVGVPLERAVEVLATAGPASRWRMEVTERPDGVTVVNDAYNANPDSVRAALRALADMDVPGRRVAVLGGMLELGDDRRPSSTARSARRRPSSASTCSSGSGPWPATWSPASRPGAGEAHWVEDTDAAHELLESTAATRATPCC